jgi:hypothetical protein
LKFYYPENFNDYIESSAFMALIESFAYVAEQLAYRIDMSAHENFISTAQRKQNILKLAKLVSYNPMRNLPLRGLVKITTVSCSEDIRDSQGTSLANKNIIWNDPNNPFWKEQFFLVMNKLMVNPFGTPDKIFQIEDTVMQVYTLNNNVENIDADLNNGLTFYNVNIGDEQLRFELVPSDLDEFGVFEKAPSVTENFTILHADDGFGDGSDTTGFMIYTKQGQLTKIPFDFTVPLQNRILDVTIDGINNTDVWIQEVDAVTKVIKNDWTMVDKVNQQNIFFNVSKDKKKYEVETLEYDRIRLLFGDGDFADIPVGFFHIWVRNSRNANGIVIQKNKVVDNLYTFGYQSKIGTNESATFRYSLAQILDNGSASEDAEHIRSYAPTTYYSQNRMVNGQDYNTLLLRDPTILRLKAVNRTFSGQPKYLT